MYRILHNGVHYGEPAPISFLETQMRFNGWKGNDGVWTLQVGDTELRASMDYVPEQKSFSELPKAPRT